VELEPHPYEVIDADVEWPLPDGVELRQAGADLVAAFDRRFEKLTGVGEIAIQRSQ